MQRLDKFIHRASILRDSTDNHILTVSKMRKNDLANQQNDW
jgi:hypothetical protein